MMDVCHLLPTCLSHHGPSGGVLAQIEAQPRDVVRSRVWSMYAPPADRDPTERLHAAGASTRVLGMGRAFLDVRVLPRLVSALRRERPDVLHCHLVRPNLYGRLAGALAGTPVVINTLRNVEDYFLATDAASRAVRAVERATQPLATHYVAVSDGVRRAAVERLGVPPERISTILNAVDLRPFAVNAHDRRAARASLGLRDDVVTIGTAGLLEPRKNQGALLRIVAALVARGVAVQVVAAGEGSARPALERLVSELGIAEVARLPGFQRDMPRFLSALDVFVMTSHQEGLPRAVMEAMAAGLPCVVSDAGGTREAVVEGVTGFVHAAADEQAFTVSLELLCREPELRTAMGQAARREAFARFAPERMASEYVALYERLLRERRGRRRHS